MSFSKKSFVWIHKMKHEGATKEMVAMRGVYSDINKLFSAYREELSDVDGLKAIKPMLLRFYTSNDINEEFDVKNSLSEVVKLVKNPPKIEHYESSLKADGFLFAFEYKNKHGVIITDVIRCIDPNKVIYTVIN